MTPFNKPLNSLIRDHKLPEFVQTTHIPKIIHQTYLDKNLPDEFAQNVERLRALNPGWEHRLYDNEDIQKFISDKYGKNVLRYYNRINPGYGAGKADFFRYLVMYAEGGVYLDIKSAFERPIDDCLQPDEKFLLVQWQNKEGGEQDTWGLHQELSHIEHGEYQQWHIVCIAGHPFLRRVIDAVMTNIDLYKPWKHGSSAYGLYRLTGPIAYTLAIHPVLDQYPHRLIRNEQTVHLVYRAAAGNHKKISANHYSQRTDSIIIVKGADRLLAYLYAGAKSFYRKAFRQVR
jgi:hypothetical protein